MPTNYVDVLKDPISSLTRTIYWLKNQFLNCYSPNISDVPIVLWNILTCAHGKADSNCIGSQSVSGNISK